MRPKPFEVQGCQDPRGAWQGYVGQGFSRSAELTTKPCFFKKANLKVCPTLLFRKEGDNEKA